LHWGTPPWEELGRTAQRPLKCFCPNEEAA
jgi:hypothetical protein